MFTHHGNTRTYSHNLSIASLLSFVAGLVNVAGFLAVQKLVTNVTGHFAFLIDEVFKLNFTFALIFFFYIFSFFLGSFCSSLIVETISRRGQKYIYVIPVLIEIIILSLAPVFGNYLTLHNPDILACSLLFAMGLQNSLVTSISNSMVRTTHLTGLFTDLGIEFSQLIFYKETDKRKRLISSIKLRLTIILFFFIGGITGGVFYNSMHLWVLLLASFVLIAGLVYDSIKYKITTMLKN